MERRLDENGEARPLLYGAFGSVASKTELGALGDVQPVIPTRPSSLLGRQDRRPDICGWSPGVTFVSGGKNLHGCVSLLAGGVGAKVPGGSAGLLFGDPLKALAMVKIFSSLP